MKKILSFLAFTAIVLTFAACNNGSDEPKAKGFQFQLDILSTKVHYVITPTNNKLYYRTLDRNYHGGTVNNLEMMADDDLKDYTVQQMLEDNMKGPKEYTVSVWDPEEERIRYAFYVAEDENGSVKRISDVSYIIYKTLPKYHLNGAFSVSPTKKVCFASSNMMQKDGEEPYCVNDQDAFYGRKSGNPHDLFPWTTVQSLPRSMVLTADEWWYLFRERPNADQLFAHATVNCENGIILLPDNWLQRPEKSRVITDKQMGIVWNEETDDYSHSSTTFNGYEQNFISKSEWQELEFAGAVFLPAAGYGDSQDIQLTGCYWSSTSVNNEKAYSFFFGSYYLNFWTMRYPELSSLKTNAYSIRNVWEVE